MANISFGVLLAPYRVDFYNYLHNHLNFDIYFQMRGFEGQMYSTEDVEKASTYEPKYLKIKRILGDRQIVLGVRNILKNSNPEFVIVPEFSIITMQVIFLKILFRLNFKIICQCDDSYDMLTGGANFSKIHAFARKICMPFLNDLILVDKKAVEWYQAKYHKGRWMPIILNEGQREFYSNDVIALSNKIKEQYGLDDKLVILFVARHIKLKNLPALLKACQHLKRPYKLIVIGDGDMRMAWEKMALDLNIDVAFVGKKNGIELDAYYYTSDIFVLPSYLEAFGAVTNEALLNGCICLISKNAGSSCLIKEGENGYIFDPYSPDDLIEKINKASVLINGSPKRNLMKYSFSELMQNAFSKL